MRFRIVFKKSSQLAVLATAVAAVVTLPVFLIPVGMRDGAPANILVVRAYAATYPVEDNIQHALIEDWALDAEQVFNEYTEESIVNEEYDINETSEMLQATTAEGFNVDPDSGLIIVAEGQTVGSFYLEGEESFETNDLRYGDIFTGTVVQTFDSAHLPIELLDPSTFTPDNTTFYIRAENSIIKETPHMDSLTLTRIGVGREVVRTGIGDTWSRIRTEDGMEGYVLTNTITEEMVFIAIDRTVWVDADGLKLRSEPSTESHILRTLSRNTRLRCVAVSDKWYRVFTDDGIEGFVYLSYTTTTAPPTPAPSRSSSPSSRSTQTSTGNTASLPRITGVNGESVVNVCISMLGTPYRWAGASRDGVDCSGLVVYAYRQVGVGGLPHQSNSLKNFGVEVSRSDIRLGDVVCYHMRGSSSDVEHVGIYAGNNQVIHASSNRNRVEYANLDMYPIVTIRRIIQ